MHPVLYNGKRAQIVLILFYCIIGLNLGYLLCNYLQIGILRDYEAGLWDEAKAEANERIYDLIRYTYLGIFYLLVVMFIMWFSRAYHNLRKFGQPIRHAPHWASVGWFVPFLNMVRPYQIMAEIWEKTHNISGRGYNLAEKGLLIAWWALWLASKIVSRFASNLKPNEDDIHGLIKALNADIYACCFEITAAIAAAYVVWKISNQETALFSLAQPKEDEEDLLGDIPLEYEE